MVMVSTLGTMANNTKVGGKTANSTERESTEKMVGTGEEFGKMEREQNGQMTKNDSNSNVKYYKINLIEFIINLLNGVKVIYNP